LYNGEIVWNPNRDRNLVDLSKSIERRPNCLLILGTNGSDPDAAYRMAHCLQKKYEKCTLFISGYCRSTGTLMAVGAYEIVIDEHGQLGPLDVQINKLDELFESGSGLDMIQALDFLRSKTCAMFTDNMVDLKLGSNNQITFNSATDVAAALTSGLFNPIY
jgi:hypothetical protein